MSILDGMSNCQVLAIGIIAFTLLYWLFINHSKNAENFCGMSQSCGAGITNNYYGDDDFSSCYKIKKIYLNADGCDESVGHGDVVLEKRFGKLYITLNCNLPYAQGGDFHTMWGAYHAFLKDNKTGEELYLGSLVRHGDHFYKLNTELLGDYRNFDEIVVIRKTEDYPAVKVLRGSIACSGNGN